MGCWPICCWLRARWYADPKIVHGTLKVVLFFAIAFGCGCLWRPTVCNFSVVLGIAKIPATLCAVLLLGYVMLANMREMGGVNDLYWAGPQYNADKTLFYDYKMRLSPFPARVVGVRYFNKYGHYVGGSAEQPCNNVLMDMRLGTSLTGVPIFCFTNGINPLW